MEYTQQPSALLDVDPLVILAFCPWPQRAAAATLSPLWRARLGLIPRPSSVVSESEGSSSGNESGYWRFLCHRLAEEHTLYVPSLCVGEQAPVPPPGVAGSWRQLFTELYALSRIVEAPNLSAEEAFSINVAVRFKPGQVTNATEGDSVVLPLHQKVQLVRERLGCTSKEAVSMIMRQRAQAQGTTAKASGFFQCPCPDPADKENIPVVPRADSKQEKSTEPIAPEKHSVAVNAEEETAALSNAADARCSILAVRADTSSVLAVTRQSGLREFTFDSVFNEAAEQTQVYELAARRLVMEFLNGRSAGIVCYGQTASGKTYTMFGPSSQELSNPLQPVERLRGVVPRACDEILSAVRSWRELGTQVELGMSYVEIFGSEVSDLLRAGQVVGQGQDGRYGAVRATDRVGHRYVLDGHTEVAVDSWSEVEAYLRAGDDVKRRAATAMNERSTRAHTILVLSLAVHGRGLATSPDGEVGSPHTSRFIFADLGGAEQLTKSQADADTKAPVTVIGGVEQSRLTWDEFYRHRQRLQETLNINKGLFSLKRVIEALHARSRLAREGAPKSQLPYVPYQDSKLTMLLQEVLGGSSRTLIVATATMDSGHATESLATLRFADTCARVEKRTEADKAASVKAALGQIAHEIKQLEEEIVKKERWETRLVRRQDVDTVAGAFGEQETTVVREEVVPQTALVGAEAERVRLEHLLQRQAELQGLSAGGGVFTDYRDLLAKETADGGRGVDFRERDRFTARAKAKDFENEVVVADAIRFLFRKAESAPLVFGETRQALRRRLPPQDIPEAYFCVARGLRQHWEEQLAASKETRSFGKYMLDCCQSWRSTIKSQQSASEEALLELLRLCQIEVPAAEATMHDKAQDVPDSTPKGSDWEDDDELDKAWDD